MMNAPRFDDVRNDASKIQLERISHVVFEHEDLTSFETFALNFGLVEAWRNDETVLYRGYGVDPYCYIASKAPRGAGSSFQGPAFVAQSQSDFDKAVALAGGKAEDLTPWPGGGKKVSLTTPSNKRLHVIYGQEERPRPANVPSAQVERQGSFNGSIQKKRYGE